MRAPSALNSRQRHAARPSLLCRSPLVLLQDAALARIAGDHTGTYTDTLTAAKNGDVERVRDLVIADPECVHDTDTLCDARPLHMLLKTKAGMRFYFERL